MNKKVSECFNIFIACLVFLCKNSLYRKSHYKENCMKRVMTILSMLIFVLVLNSCVVETKSETDALLIPKMVFVKGGIIEGKDYPWAPPKGNFPKGRCVQLSDFAIGKYEVTQEEYYSVMKDEVVSVTAYVDGVGERTAEFFVDSRPSFCKPNNPPYHCFEGEKQERRPVEGITFYDALWYCNVLSRKTGLEPVYKIKVLEVTSVNFSSHITSAEVEMIPGANGYRLPTLCEAEYAMRGGDPKAPDWDFLFSGADSEPGRERYSINKGLDPVGWYQYNNKTGISGTSDSDQENNTYYKYKGTHEVGLKKPNRLGLYDMSGNVSEYCYGKIDYTKEPKYTGELEINPVRIDETGNYRPSYGGSWYSGAGSAIVHSFPANPGSYSTDSKGFRVVRSAK